MKFYLWKRGAPMFNWGGPVFGFVPPSQSGNIGGDPLPISVRSSPIVSYRVWRVSPTREGLALVSLNMPYEWQVENTAECLTNRPSAFTPFPIPVPHDDPAPSLSCACGFYVSLPDRPLSEWEHLLSGKVHASGTVALTGRVIRCERGMKAENAEIQSPVVIDVDCASSQSCDGDVTRIDIQATHARGWCDTHAPQVGAVVEAAAYMRNAIKELTGRYDGLEFISWI